MARGSASPRDSLGQCPGAPAPPVQRVVWPVSHNSPGAPPPGVSPILRDPAPTLTGVPSGYRHPGGSSQCHCRGQSPTRRDLVLGTRGCGHPHCAGGCLPVPRGWGQDIPCRPPLHGRSPHLPHRPRTHPCARGSGSGPPSLGGQSSQGGRWVLCTGRNIQPGRIPEPCRGKAGPSLNAPIPPLCPNPGAAEPSMGSEPEPTTFLQTCLGVGFVSSRGLDEGWQDRRMDRMDRQTDGQQWCFGLEGEIQHQLPHLGRTSFCCQVCVSLGELLRVLKVI